MEFTHTYLNSLGIYFLDDTVEKAFLDVIQKTFEIRIGEKTFKNMSQEKIREFDSITDTDEAAKWLELNRPNWRNVIEEEERRLSEELIQHKDWIAGTDNNNFIKTNFYKNIYKQLEEHFLHSPKETKPAD